MARNSKKNITQLRPDIFSGKTDTYLGEESHIVNPEYRVPLPIKGLDSGCHEKMYKLVSLTKSARKVGVAPQGKKQDGEEFNVPSRLVPAYMVLPHIPPEMANLIRQIQATNF